MKPLPIKILLAAWTSLTFAGCQTTSEQVLPARGPLIEHIYFGTLPGARAPRPRPPIDLASAAALQTCEMAELQARFPRLPNPTLVMYVYPHLSEADRVPIPGYSTYFTLYETLEPALPGEPSEPPQLGVAPACAR